MYKIVLKRIGRKKVNYYKIIARNTNIKNKKKTLYIGFYNKKTSFLNKMLISKLIYNGCKLSNKVRKILNDF
ncbi:hypothetical protein ACT2CC_00345 [Candidatus Vidania fulgoroideorum]